MFKIGTKFIRRAKNKKSERVSTIVDVYTTTNSKGEIVKVCYVTEHEFMGQIVTNPETPAATIQRAKESGKFWEPGELGS